MAKNQDRDPDELAPPAAAKPAEPIGMPKGDTPLEYRRTENLHLARAGRVVKENFVGRILGRSVRVYYGAPEAKLPDAVRKVLAEHNIPIGIITLEELGLRPRETGIVNLTQQG